MIDLEISRIAEKYGVNVIHDGVGFYADKNIGSSDGENIWLSDFDDEDIKLIAFFHELGHCQNIKRSHFFTKISSEGRAWEIGLDIAFDEGYKYEQDSKELLWARNQLITYRDDNDNWM